MKKDIRPFPDWITTVHSQFKRMNLALHKMNWKCWKYYKWRSYLALVYF